MKVFFSYKQLKSPCGPPINRPFARTIWDWAFKKDWAYYYLQIILKRHHSAHIVYFITTRATALMGASTTFT